MEATGGLERPLSKASFQAGLPAAIVNPRRIRDFGRSMGILANTDKLDAKVMALFAAKIEPALRPIQDEASQKLENPIMAPVSGTVTEINVAVKQQVETGKPLVVIEY